MYYPTVLQIGVCLQLTDSISGVACSATGCKSLVRIVANTVSNWIWQLVRPIRQKRVIHMRMSESSCVWTLKSSQWFIRIVASSIGLLPTKTTSETSDAFAVKPARKLHRTDHSIDVSLTTTDCIVLSYSVRKGRVHIMCSIELLLFQMLY